MTFEPAVMRIDRLDVERAKNAWNLNRWRCLMAWREHTLSNAMPCDPRNEQQRLAGKLLHVKRAVRFAWLCETLNAKAEAASIAEACAGQVPGNCRVISCE